MIGETMVDDARAYCKAKGLRDPKKAFAVHRSGARDREIPFEMTFDEWWTLWQPFFHMRGRGANDFCMARKDDKGPYKVGNVHMTTKLGNSAEYHGPKNAKKQARKEREGRYWGRDNRHSEAVSHRAYKIHCNPKKFVAQ